MKSAAARLVCAALLAALAAMPSPAAHSLGECATLRGVVTFARGGTDFAFMLTDEGVCARLGLAGGNHASVGEIVEATGDVSMLEPNLRMESVVVTHAGNGTLPMREPATISELNNPAQQRCGLPVELTVRVLDVNRRRTQMQLYVCDLDAAAEGATASFPMKESALADSELKRNAIVRIRAVPSMIYADEGVKNLTLNILCAEDVEVLTRAPWWTMARIAVAVAVAVFAIVMLAGWIVFLKRADKAQRRVREERLRLSMGLHDEFQQQLAGTMFLLDAAASVCNDPHAVARQIDSARKSLAVTQIGLRSILWGLQQAGREADTLAGMLKTASLRMPHWQGIVEIDARREGPREIRRQGVRLLMIFQEAVGNAIKHGGATKVVVALDDDGRIFSMSITDNGCGFDPAKESGAPGHMGLVNMRLRAEAMGAVFSIDSAPGKGSTIKIEVQHD